MQFYDSPCRFIDRFLGTAPRTRVFQEDTMQSFFNTVRTFVNGHREVVKLLTLCTVSILIFAELLAVFTPLDFKQGLLIVVAIMSIVIAVVIFIRIRMVLARRNQQSQRPQSVQTAQPQQTAAESATPIQPVALPVQPQDATTIMATKPKEAGKLDVNYLSAEDNNESGSLWPYLMIMPLAFVPFLVVLSVISTFMIWRTGSVPFWMIVVPAIIIFGIAAYYSRQTEKAQKERALTPERAQIAYVTDPKYMRLNQHALGCLMHTLIVNNRNDDASDKVVLAATRKVWQDPILRTVAPVKVKRTSAEERTNKVTKPEKKFKRQWRRFYIALLGLSVMVWALHFGVKDVSIAVFVLFGVFCLVFMAVLAKNLIDWYSWYFVLTDKRAMVIIQWPVLLWWRDGRSPQIEGGEIRWCEPLDQDNWISKAFHDQWGVVDVDGLTDHDTDLNEMTGMPYHQELSQLVASIKPAKEAKI